MAPGQESRRDVESEQKWEWMAGAGTQCSLKLNAQLEGDDETFIWRSLKSIPNT